MTALRDHGGGVDIAVARHGGDRAGWLDLSTGINPVPYPLPDLPGDAWTALPDTGAQDALCHAARRFWQVPPDAALLAAPGASALIARIPALAPPGRVDIPAPTYNEHAAAFDAHGWQVIDSRGGDSTPGSWPQTATGAGRFATAAHAATARVAVNPNNPDGRVWSADQLPVGPLTVIDESFADAAPEVSLIGLAARPGTLVLKSFGKFWGLAGLRLGFVAGDPALLRHLAEALGPWPVSGPALRIGAAALDDPAWAAATRRRLGRDAARLDALMTRAGAESVGGTTLFRLYEHAAAPDIADRLAHAHILVRTFPYAPGWLRLGLPGSEADWTRLANAL